MLQLFFFFIRRQFRDNYETLKYFWIMSGALLGKNETVISVHNQTRKVSHFSYAHHPASNMADTIDRSNGCVHDTVAES